LFVDNQLVYVHIEGIELIRDVLVCDIVIRKRAIVVVALDVKLEEFCCLGHSGMVTKREGVICRGSMVWKVAERGSSYRVEIFVIFDSGLGG
jgi:hypothetical protein